MSVCILFISEQELIGLNQEWLESILWRKARHFEMPTFQQALLTILEIQSFNSPDFSNLLMLFYEYIAKQFVSSQLYLVS